MRNYTMDEAEVAKILVTVIGKRLGYPAGTTGRISYSAEVEGETLKDIEVTVEFPEPAETKEEECTSSNES